MRSRGSIVLYSGDAQVAIEPLFGGRLSSWRVGGVELLWQPDGPIPGASHPFGWGSFVMAPYAGRVRRGQLHFNGEVHALPIAMAPHAIHGTVYDSPWQVDGVWSSSPSAPSADGDPQTGARCQLSCPFGRDWPFRGTIHQEIELVAVNDRSGELRQRIWVEAADAMPVTMGWHPWFPRHLPGADGPFEWSFDRESVAMFERDGDGIATSNLVAIPPGPWDDCFQGVGEVTVRWPGLMELSITHDCPVVVLFDGLDHAVCVEPQTGPPDATSVWGDRVRLGAGETTSASTSWRWSHLG